jgi:hypothetical protein
MSAAQALEPPFDTQPLPPLHAKRERAYADEGAALWLLLQQQLIGSRLLHRRADARIIVNTAARWR